MTSRTTRLTPPWPREPENTKRLTQPGILTSTQHKAGGDEEVDQSAGRGDPEVGRPAGGQEYPQRGDEHEGLGDLDGEDAEEGPPPQLGQPFGLGQGVADQADWRGDHEQDHEGEADDVGGEHDDGESGDDTADEHHEDAAVGQGAENQLAEHGGGLGGVDALAHDRLGERVGGRDHQTGQAEAGVDGDGGDDDAGEDVFDGGAGLEGLVAHDDGPADQDEENQEGIGDAFGHAPQLADPALGGDVGGGKQGVAEEGEDRVERGGDEVAEPRSRWRPRCGR